MEKKFDAYQMVTDKIIALMESGIIPWARPWTGVQTSAWSRSTGEAYSFLNQMLLADPDKHYADMNEMLADVRGEWLTFKQCQEAGGRIKKGAKGRPVVFFKMLPVPDGDKTNENGEQLMKNIPLLKYYTVFRVDQCEGIEQKHHKNDGQPGPAETVKPAEDVIRDYIQHYGIKLNHVAGNRAYYSPMLDCVVLPLREQFKSTADYYDTCFHELTHSTGHESRLNRISKVAAFGSEDYSTEELTAEIGAASISATLGLSNDHSLRNAAAYVQNWLAALKNDKKMIVVAAARAEKAIEMILNA